MHANNREDIKEAYAGDIVALAGLKDTRTGDTLCDMNKPVIACVNGMAVGGGFELALSCDLIYASDHSSFALPEIRAGAG